MVDKTNLILSLCIKIDMPVFPPLSSATFSIQGNHVGGVMVSVFASSVVDRGFEPRSGQTKDYKFGICCFR
jgi:hypothetical protein